MRKTNKKNLDKKKEKNEEERKKVIFYERVWKGYEGIEEEEEQEEEEIQLKGAGFKVPTDARCVDKKN